MTRSVIRSARFTLSANQEMQFQADAFLYVTTSTGNVSLNGSAMNDIPGGLLLSTGTKLSGPVRDGVAQPIGLVFLRNESATASAVVEVVTSNGDIAKDSLIGASQVIQQNDIYTASLGFTTGGNLLSVSMESANAKAIKLRRVIIHNIGTLAAAAVASFTLYRLAGVPSGGSLFAGSGVSRTRPSMPNPAAVVRSSGPTATPGSSLRAIARAMVPTTLGNHPDIMVDLTNGGTQSPMISETSLAGAGFVIICNQANLGAALSVEWTEE